MKKKCSNCGKEVGFFSRDECSYEDCEIVSCEDCSILKQCPKCEELFCSTHLKNHECEVDEENKEDDIITFGDYVIIKNEYLRNIPDNFKRFKENYNIINISVTPSEDYILLLKKKEVK